MPSSSLSPSWSNSTSSSSSTSPCAGTSTDRSVVQHQRRLLPLLEESSLGFRFPGTLEQGPYPFIMTGLESECLYRQSPVRQVRVRKFAWKEFSAATDLAAGANSTVFSRSCCCHLTGRKRELPVVLAGLFSVLFGDKHTRYFKNFSVYTVVNNIRWFMELFYAHWDQPCTIWWLYFFFLTSA